MRAGRRARGWGGWLIAILATAPCVVSGQQAQPDTRTAQIEREQEAKVSTLHPYEPNAGERWALKIQNILAGTSVRWHPFLQSAYNGGGFTLGAGYTHFVSPFNFVDMRGSYTRLGYKRIETAFMAPRLFKRRGALSVLGGWREATQVGFYGLGPETTPADRTNYAFTQPYLSGLLTVKPTRHFLTLDGGLEFSRWNQEPGEGAYPTVGTRYTPVTLPGLGASVDYLHTQAMVAMDSRPSPGYSRRGTFLGITAHDYIDGDEEFGFRRITYEAIHHIPILREAWVISLHGLANSTYVKDQQEIPFFMLPSLGGGSNLRGYHSWRFRDRYSLLLQGEWRIMINRFMETALFYDSGQVSRRASDLDFSFQQRDYGIGFRMHGPVSTPVRIDLARSREGFVLVFSSSAVF